MLDRLPRREKQLLTTRSWGQASERIVPISYGGRIATEQVPLGWDDGHWLNAPAATAREGRHLIVTSVEGSDFWRTTAYGFIHDDGHALLRPLQIGEATEVSFILDYDQQFDQAGVLVRASETTWVKAGVEISRRCRPGRRGRHARNI
jgi:Protein of unknown function (DUF1349)